jgi:hypothetical protein
MNSAASALDRVRLTEYLARVRSAKAASQTTIPHVVSESPAPLSVSQEDIWRLSQESGLPPLFNESVTIHRHGQLQVSVLEKALGEIVRRHEAWRATFEVLDGKPVQGAGELKLFRISYRKDAAPVETEVHGTALVVSVPWAVILKIVPHPLSAGLEKHEFAPP